MKVKIFLETAGNFSERELLQRFYNGIKSSISAGMKIDNDSDESDEVIIDIDKGHSACDVAVIMGSWKPREKDHHLVRTSVVENSPCFIVIETPLLGRKMFQANKQYRIGVNGFLNNSGVFCLPNQITSSRMSTTWNGWRNNANGHIVLMMQLPGDASLRGINIYQWATDTIEKIRLKTDKKIIIRTHPGYTPKDGDEYYKFISNLFISKVKNIEFSIGKEKTLLDDLQGAYCSIAYTSGSSIDSVVEGIPTIACDPGNFTYEISTNFLSDINNLKMADAQTVTKWLQKLSYSQWSIEEMESGKVWKHLIPMLDEKLKTIPKKGKR